MHLSEQIIKQKPDMWSYGASSLSDRLAIMNKETPKLGEKAALNAIKEWGQPKSKITHLVFCTSTSLHMPCADYQLANLLRLEPTVKRVMLCLQGCIGGGTALRIAKDLAENNKDARVLIVCSEIMSLTFCKPQSECLESLALYGDGAAAVIVGSDPNTPIERPLFELFSTSQMIIPNTESKIQGHVREMGLVISMAQDLPTKVSDNIKKCIPVACVPNPRITEWNSLFYIVHPSGPAILDKIEEKLELRKEKLKMSRDVLREYGNTVSSSVFFVMDKMRKESKEKNKSTADEGLEWGVLFALGPGVTVETVVLRSFPPVK